MNLSCIKTSQYRRNSSCVCNVYVQANSPPSLPPHTNSYTSAFTLTPSRLAYVIDEKLLRLTVSLIEDITIKMIRN